jgi:methanogenic corrinoid protein MtbC1
MRLWFHLNWLHGEHAVAGRGGKSGEENQKPASAGRSGEGGKTERRAGKVQLSEHLSDPDMFRLEGAIRDHVIRELENAHPASPPPIIAEPEYRSVLEAISDRQVLKSLLDPDPSEFHDLMDRLVETQARLKHVCSMLISPLAGQLGRMWNDDSLAFTQVSIAAGRLSMLIHRVAMARRQERPGTRRHSVLFARMPGENHTLGLGVVSACFREAGWDVDGGPDVEIDDRLLEKLGRRRYKVFGISVGNAGGLPKVGNCIREVSQRFGASRPVIGIGGPAVHGNDKRLAGIGADFIATDAWSALEYAEQLVD